MNILMLTNTYLPHVGGVARSVSSFTEEFRRRSHRVVVVAPTYEDQPADETDVVRVPAIQNFNGSDFSLGLPIPGWLSAALERFEPDIVHGHHPFLLGVTALRVAAARNRPVLFTHHTMYEQYTHYLPGDSPLFKRMAVQLGTQYANLCDHVIAPSESVAAVLRERGVTVPVTAVPTGIDPRRFARGDGPAARRRFGIPLGAFVVGHVGRLAPEKNLGFLARAAATFLEQDEGARFFVVGAGPALDEIKTVFAERGLADRLHLTEEGPLEGQELADAYHAMDVFAFASQSETQGMVLAEAMTAGVPVVAVDAPGAREVVKDRVNGRLLEHADEVAFARALREVADGDVGNRRALTEAALATAESFALAHCAERLLGVYEGLVRRSRPEHEASDDALAQTLRVLENEWDLWSSRVEAVVKAVVESL